MTHHIHTLKNGIRLLHVPASSTISHACIIINTGSRDEAYEQIGVAHFIEHLIFKRTKKRSTSQILNRLESVGADLNAYTTKEYTCVHASFLNPYLDRTLELFNDIVFHSTFPEDEMEKEKGVILDEISSYQDQPEEAIADDFEDLLFAGHQLGHNILGTAETVAKLTRENIKAFMAQHYKTDEIVVAVFGNYSLNKAIKIASRYFASIPANTSSASRNKPKLLPPASVKITKPISQAHVMLGKQTYSMHNEQKIGLLLLNNIFGGTGMSAILNLQLREKHGIAYTIESSYTPLTDTGIFNIYFGTDQEKVDKALQIIHKEFKKFKQSPLTPLQLQKAQNKFIGQIALGEENRISLIIAMAKSLLDYDKIDSLDTIFNKIKGVTSLQIADLANEILDEQSLTSLIFSPENPR